MKKKATKKKKRNRTAHSQSKTAQGKHSKTKPHYSGKTYDQAHNIP